MAEDTPDCCDGCLKWAQFKEKCWVYWERKKSCTQKITDVSEIRNF